MRCADMNVRMAMCMLRGGLDVSALGAEQACPGLFKGAMSDLEGRRGACALTWGSCTQEGCVQKTMGVQVVGGAQVHTGICKGLAYICIQGAGPVKGMHAGMCMHMRSVLPCARGCIWEGCVCKMACACTGVCEGGGIEESRIGGEGIHDSTPLPTQ